MSKDSPVPYVILILGGNGTQIQRIVTRARLKEKNALVIAAALTSGEYSMHLLAPDSLVEALRLWGTWTMKDIAIISFAGGTFRVLREGKNNTSYHPLLLAQWNVSPSEYVSGLHLTSVNTPQEEAAHLTTTSWPANSI